MIILTDSAYHTVYFWREILIKKYPFKCTSIWTSIIKRLWRGKKMFKVTLKLQRYFVIYIRSPLKMQKIKKPRSPSRQLSETVNFAFMKIFDFLVKKAIFRVFLLFFGRFASRSSSGSRVRMHDANLPKKGEMLLKRLFWLKNQKFL